jgi:meiotic recombination protein SPO11
MMEAEERVEGEEQEQEQAVASVVSLDEALRRVEGAVLSCLSGMHSEAGGVVLLGRDLFKSPKLFARTLRVLNLIHALLTEDRMSSQRDAYYQLAPFFGSAEECNSEINFIARLLHLSRISLNVHAASRGFVVGQLSLLDETGQWTDLATLGRDGRPINGDLSDLCRPIRAPNARFVLVVEKEGIYQELSDAKFYNHVPCILVTAHGVPDVATRAFVARLSRDLNIPVLCLADWNPGGAQVVFTYRFGSIGQDEKRRTAPEGTLYEIPNFFWLGLHWEDVAGLQEEHKMALTNNDLAKINNLVHARKIQSLPAVQTQLHLMAQHAVRVELQAWRDQPRTLAEHITKKILTQNMIRM